MSDETTKPQGLHAVNERTLHNSVPQCDMPREKFLRLGAGGVTDTDLIAIMLRTGTPEMNVMETARRLYEMFGESVIRMGDASIGELMQLKGLGEAKAIALAAALELGKRRQLEELDGLKIRSSEDCHKFFFPKIAHLSVEEFRVAVVNSQLRVIGESVISTGGLSGTVVDIRRLMREVIRLGGVGFFVAHNHPSGSTKPSQNDRDLTRRIAAAAKTLDLRFIDHVIVARGSAGQQYYSFSDEGLID